MEKKKVLDSILEAIGNTPMVRLNKIPKEEGVECEVLVKCEYMNPTGSHKDRLALNLIETAEREGKLTPGGTVIEATSGNTGLALAFVAAVKGYRAIMVTLPKTSQEKTDLIQGFGADTVRTKTNSSKGPDSLFAVAEKLTASIPGAFYTSQFTNPANPVTHYVRTAEEIVYQCDGKLDCFFMSAGTGGTISGTGKKLKEKIPGVKVIGCDPVGSVIGSAGGVFIPFKVEGVGYDFVPKNCDLSVIDEWLKFSDKDAFDLARRVTREEGLMCGGSSGGIIWCALQYAKKMKLTKDQRVVVILADTSRNYLTKYVNNEWLLEYGFADEDTYRKVAMEASLFPDKRYGDDLQLKDLECPELKIVHPEQTIGEVWKLLQTENFVMVNGLEQGKYRGILLSKDALSAISTGKFTFADTVEKIFKTDFCILSETIKVSTAGKMLESREYLLFKRSDTQKIYVATPATIMAKLH
jgi:cystathionine beta-synthase